VHIVMKKRAGSTGKLKGRMGGMQSLMLTSMLDILTVILFFLLINYSYVVTTFSVAKDLSLPRSNALTPPPGSVLQLVVTQTAILLDEKELVPIENGDIPRSELWRDGVTITKLAQALDQHKKRSLYVQKRSDTHSFTGTIVLQADKSLRFRLLKKVIYTAGINDYVNLKLAVLKIDI